MSKVDHILIHPCPPTNSLGAIKQIHRNHPISSPCSVSLCLGVVGFLWAIKWWLRLIGYIFRAKFGQWGDLIPWPNCNGQTKLHRLSQTKNQPHHNQLSGASLCLANQLYKGKAAMFVTREIWGNIWRLVGGEGMTNWRPGGLFQWVRPIVLLKHTTINLGSAGQGLNLAGNGELAAFCFVHFFGIMAGGFF